MSVFARVAQAIATGIYSGYAPRAPGTVGSLLAFVLWYGLAALGYLDSYGAQLLLIVVVTLAGCLSTHMLLQRLKQAANTEVHDPGFIVIDEWAGLAVSLFGVSYLAWAQAITAFVLFRLFDIIKPGPVGWAERVPGVWGIMLDDLVAGLFALGLVHLIWQL